MRYAELLKPPKLAIAQRLSHGANLCRLDLQRQVDTYIDKAQWGILESGPETEHYWDVWDEVLSNAETDCGGVLHQTGLVDCMVSKRNRRS